MYHHNRLEHTWQSFITPRLELKHTYMEKHGVHRWTFSAWFPELTTPMVCVRVNYAICVRIGENRVSARTENCIVHEHWAYWSKERRPSIPQHGVTSLHRRSPWGFVSTRFSPQMWNLKLARCWSLRQMPTMMQISQSCPRKTRTQDDGGGDDSLQARRMSGWTSDFAQLDQVEQKQHSHFWG